MEILKTSIRAKLIAAFLVPIVAIAGFACIFFPLQQRAQSLEMAQDQVTTLSDMLAFSVGAGLSEGSFDLVQTAFEWAKSNSNVRYIAIQDEDGEPIFEHNPEALDVDRAEAVADGEAVRAGDLITDAAAVTYGDEDLGDVVLVYSLAEFNAARAKSLFVSIVVNLLLLAAGIALVLFITGRIMHQILTLRKAAYKVSQGKLDTEIDVETQDEIGDLAVSFRKMVEDIRAGQQAIEAEKAAVEQKVEDAVAAAEAEKEYLNRSVDRMLVEMEHFADGDLTVRLEAERDDEIARLFDGFNRAVDGIRNALLQLNHAIGQTSQTSGEIRQSTDQLSMAVQEQSAQADEVAAAVEQMVSTIIENARNATHTSEIAQQSGQAARNGGDVVRQTVEKIREIADVVSESSETVERLGDSSEQIGEIVQVISDIADQTNLLALNAAIEAARAGEQGRGFAVVADEVRKLAERTTQATQQIGTMIRQIQQETQTAVSAMRRGGTEVQAGIRLADEAGQSLGSIVDGTQQTEDMVRQIAAASEEQSTTSEQIARSVASISAVSAESAEGTGQIAHAVEGLTALSGELRELVERFRLGTAPAGAPAQPRSAQVRPAQPHAAAGYGAAPAASGDGFGQAAGELPSFDGSWSNDTPLDGGNGWQ